MTNGIPSEIVDLKVTKSEQGGDSWLTVIDYKSCFVVFGDVTNNDEYQERKQKIKVYSCYAA